MKQSIPWPIKFSLKLLFGLVGVNYKWLKRTGIVEHGRMEQVEFARGIFQFHVLKPSSELGTPLAGTLLEIGPGDSVATGVLGRAAGFGAVDLVDVDCFADLQPAALDRLLTSLGAQPCNLPRNASATATLACLRGRGIRYLTEGLKSLKSIDSSSIGYSFSNTVLQHVRLAELPQLLRELARVHAPGTFGSHSVNFTDHFSGGFVNRRLPAWFMESEWVKRSNLYTNRVPPSAYPHHFESSGLQVARMSVNFHDSPQSPPVVFHSVQDYLSAAAARTILRAVFILHKSSAP